MCIRDSGLAVLCGRCAPPEPAPGPDDGGASPPGGFPAVFHSDDDTVLRLEAPPARVLPANTSAVDMVTALVPPDRVVALPDAAFEYSHLAVEPGPWAELPRLPRFLAEPVLGLAPDLVITHSWHDAGTTRILRAAGIPVMVLPEVRTFEDVRRSFLLVGRLLGEEAASRAQVAELDRRLAALQEAAAGRRELVAVCYTNFSTGGWTAGRETTADILMGLAGLRNGAAEAGMVGNVEIHYEKLIDIDPDLFLVGNYSEAGGSGATAAFLRSEAPLADLTAVREGRIAVLPAHLISANSNRLIEAAEYLAREVERMFGSDVEEPEGRGE